MPSVYIKTYGCQMNERDSEAVAAQLAARGYAIAPSEGVADVVLLNTCSVRDMAEQKAIGKMRTLSAETRRERPGVVLGFLGCMAQSRGAELLRQARGVRLVVGTQKFHRTGEFLDELLSGRQASIVETGEEAGSEGAIREHLASDAGGTGVTAFVSIMQGCNQRCTFCIVPFTRGQERSRPIEAIVAECRGLVERGVKEVTLLGQIVTSYGRREIGVRDGKSAFVQLLEAVQGVDGIERIRFTSPHPKGYGDDLIGSYGRLSKLCESAHIPVQSGSDRILKQMGRGYTRGRYLEILRKLRQVHPGMGVSTDFIVGFPGETEEEFQDTLALAREGAFDQAYIFRYSPRRDTPAAQLGEQTSPEVREERNARLLAVVNEVAQERFDRAVGTQVQVLVQGPSRRNAARLQGRTRTNRIVVFDGARRHIGQLMDLRITRTGSFTLYGDPAIVNLDGA